jgi:hypothetical protein
MHRQRVGRKAGVGTYQAAHADVFRGIIKAPKGARTRHGFPHRRTLIEYFLELYRRRSAERDIIRQRLGEDEPKLGPRQRLHVRGLMPHYRQQILAETARAEIPERLFIAGLCWWGLSFLQEGNATPTGDGPEEEIRSSTC